MKARKLTLIIALIVAFAISLQAQEVKLNTRYSYFTTEKQAEVLFVLPGADPVRPVKISVDLNNQLVFTTDTIAANSLLTMRIPIDKAIVGSNLISARITLEGKTISLKSELVKLLPKSNGVRIDRLTGKLIVNGLPYFPFGFYCYSPVSPTIAEEEVVKGFNLMSPYQTVDPRTLADRQTYMDRCARLGMKVHYQLISIAGGGGVGSSRLDGISQAQKMNRLKQEVEHFRDHPALLAWYLSDEPTGQGVSPDSLQKMYDFVHELDPYHPITIVFDAPQRAREYASVMDIVMADPYPIPNSGVDGVGSVTEGLKREFEYEKPVWIVPQAFGGGEWWGREPSPQEIRAMTYLALVRGATGIQYFIRQGLNGFPKSTVAWGECSKVALEVAEINDYLLNGTPVPELMQIKDGIWINAWKLGDDLLVMAVNAKNEPRQFRVVLPDIKDSTSVEVLFTNRRIKTSTNAINDWIGPMDAQVYRIRRSPEPKMADTSISQQLTERNLISDPGFENMLSYGVPAMCYAHVGSDPGSTAFLDTRTKVTGNHSLRLVTPESGKGMALSFFPVSLNSGQSYRFSIFARADTTTWLPGKKLSFFQKLMGKKSVENRNFLVMVGDLGKHSFTPTADWKLHTFYLSVAENSEGQVKINPYLELIGQGTAWFDEMTLTEDPLISYRIDQNKRRPEIEIRTGTPDAKIRYNMDGIKPEISDPEYTGPLAVSKSIAVAAGIFKGNELLSWSVQKFKSHLAVGHIPVYEKKFASNYSAGGSLGLVDGQFGTRNYQDGKWQGFNGQDLKAVIDLDTIQTIRKVSLGFLQNISAWIFMPLKVEVEGSSDGINYRPLGYTDNQVDEHAKGVIRKDFLVEFSPAQVRYIRVKATNRKICPDWHNGKGKAAFIFVDEIAVE
jgi:hypothetical protein